jgi:soluble lytic murein transglycosylase-like protein
MVLVMDRDGSLSPSQSQQNFSRTYENGVGQEGPADAGLRILDDAVAQADNLQAPKRTRTPRPDILAAIEDTALRYAGHRGPRAARITATGWLNLYRANIEIESGYDPGALSPAGAIGLGQLMPGTADLLGVDPHDWRQNLDGSARYLAWMLAEFGDMRLALAAYNAGPDAVRAHSGIPPFTETRNHVQRVLAVFSRLEGAPL